MEYEKALEEDNNEEMPENEGEEDANEEQNEEDVCNMNFS